MCTSSSCARTHTHTHTHARTRARTHARTRARAHTHTHPSTHPSTHTSTPAQRVSCVRACCPFSPVHSRPQQQSRCTRGHSLKAMDSRPQDTGLGALETTHSTQVLGYCELTRMLLTILSLPDTVNSLGYCPSRSREALEAVERPLTQGRPSWP